jgi:hypothetical protein
MRDYLFTRWMWRGKPIHDIRAWARERNEQMVQYIEYQRQLVPYGPPGGQFVTEETPGEMPESFWNGMHFTADHWYTETGRTNA